MTERAIWKFPLLPSNTDELLRLVVAMPTGAKILHVGAQKNEIYLWAEVDVKEMGRQDRLFWAAGTGHALPKGIGKDETAATVLGSVMLFDGDLVFHIFEICSPEEA